MVILTGSLHDGPQVLAEFLQRWPSNKPPTVIDGVDRQIGPEGEGIGQCQEPIFEVRRCDLNHVELSDGFPLVVAEKREGGIQSGAEGRIHLGRIRTDHGKLAVVDLQVFLQLVKAPNLARTFRSPIAAVEAQDERKAIGKLG